MDENIRKRLKKVCVMTTVHTCFDKRIFYKECKTLAIEGYDVTLIAQHNKKETVDGVKIVPLTKTKSHIYRMIILSLVAFQKALQTKADIYHFHDPELIPIAILLKLFTRKVVIYDVHENVPKQISAKMWIPTMLLRNLMGAIASLANMISVVCFNHIIVAAEDIAVDIGPKAKNIVVVRNFPPEEFIGSCKNNYAKSNVIIYSGVIVKERCIKEMVEAMAYVKSKCELWLLGNFLDQDLENEVKKIAGCNVKFIGEVPQPKVPNFLKVAKIGIVCFYPMPNNMDSIFGRNNKIYEYMAAGLAIIASNFPKWKEFIEDEGFGITVNSMDARNIANAIDYLLDNPDIITKMGEKGRKAVEERYNWAHESRKLLQLYEEAFK